MPFLDPSIAAAETSSESPSGKPAYLHDIEPLPADLLSKAQRIKLSRADAQRWRNEVARRKAAIRAARDCANLGRCEATMIRPEAPYGVF